jgi:hypothetical protein
MDKERDQGRAACLVTWEWVGDQASRDENVAAILRPSVGSSYVRELVEFLYMKECSTVVEQIACVLYKRQNPYPAQFGQTRAGHPSQGEIQSPKGRGWGSRGCLARLWRSRTIQNRTISRRSSAVRPEVNHLAPASTPLYGLFKHPVLFRAMPGRCSAAKFPDLRQKVET